MNDQRRQASGTYQGGQYATMPRSEPDVVLDPDEVYNADGTFEFPPFARSSTQVIAFWSKVHVSDEVLRQMQRAYVGQQEDARTEVLERWKASNPMPNRVRLGGRPNPAYDEWMEELTAQDLALQAAQPADIPPGLARPLARAAGMYEQAADLDEEDEPGALERFWAHKMPIGPKTIAMDQLLAMYPVHTLARETWIDRTSEANLNAAARLEELASS